ncbi:hypothetical protein GCM10009547_27550 [Sporichthya brevicatena]|uniref:Htaa domain-containing protein n=1 Tax=Sporichthya brevicatena TaxID=171442 RepID=A0ABP3S158_9ACTN
MKTHQKREARHGLRRVTAVTGAAALAAATLVVGATQATAAEQTITGASFTWGLTDYIQYTGTGAPGTCHYLSAGSLDGTSGANTQSSYKAVDGNVTIKLGDGDPTWATKCSGFGNFTGGQTATGSPANQRVVWSGGTGTRDSSTGEATITFPGTLSVKFSGAPFRIVDPVLTIDSAGTGTLKATIKAGADPLATVDTPGVTVAELTGLNTGSTAEFTTTPTFAGRTITVGANTVPTEAVQTAYDALGADRWGAWPESFVNAANTGSVNAGGRFYNSGTTTTGDGFKYPLPITVNYGTVTGGETPGDGQTITVTVPEAPEECAGEVVWALKNGTDGDVALTPGTAGADHLPFTGALDPITFTDGRTGDGAACYPSFGVSGQVSDFTGPEGATISGANLGWTPNVTGAGLTAGAPVASGIGGGSGLSQPATLATTTAGSTGSGDAGADLELKAPLDADAGDYEGTLTLTALT